MKNYLEEPIYDLYSSKMLYDFVQNNYDGKLLKDAKSSIDLFWNHYVGFESLISFQKLKKFVKLFLKDLKIETKNNKTMLYNLMKYVALRQKKYYDIDLTLKSFNVSDADRKVTLDAYDFAINSNDPIDFVTFDDVCFEGAKNTFTIEFNSIQGRFDFD